MSPTEISRSAGISVLVVFATAALTGCPPSVKNPTPVAVAISAIPGGTGSQEYQKVLGAMLAVEYWADNTYPPLRPPPWPLLSPNDAVQVLCKSGYGAKTRESRARIVLNRLPRASLAPCPADLAVSMGEFCAPLIKPCFIKYATPEDPEADIHFRMPVEAPHTTVAGALDPQSWNTQEGSSFEVVQRTGDKKCPEQGTAPEIGSGEDSQLGGTWEETLYELFQVEYPANNIAVSLKQTLCIDSEHHTTLPMYRMSYEVCRNLNYENWIWGGPKVRGVLHADDGCTYADSRDDGSKSKVGATKRLRLNPAFCGTKGCDDSHTELLGYGLKVLAVETAIAMSRLESGETHPCSETFTCTKTDNAAKYQCLELRDFPAAARCGN